MRAEVVTAGRLAIRLGKLDEAAAAFDESLTIAGQENDVRLQAKAMADRALVHMERAEFDAARLLLERAEATQRERPDGQSPADTLDSLGVSPPGLAATVRSAVFGRELDALPG